DVLVAGGFTSDLEITDSAEIYHSATGHWTPTGSLTDARFAHTATLLQNGKVLAAGGAQFDTGFNTVVLASAELFLSDTGTWVVTGSLSEARVLHTSTLLPTGRVLAV